MTWLVPSVETTTGWGQVTVPTPPAQVKVTVTLELFHPATLGAGLGVAEIVSAVPRVTLRFDEAVLPATSVACTAIVFGPVTRVRLQEKDCPLRAAVTPLQVTFATPESVSATVPVTVICGVVTVAADAGEVMESVGVVLSILSVTEAVAVLPAASVAVREMTWFPPSFEMTTLWGDRKSTRLNSSHLGISYAVF